MTKVNLLVILAGAVSVVLIAIRLDGRFRAGGGTALVRVVAIAISLAAVGVLLAVHAGKLPEWTLVPPFLAWAAMTTYPERFQRVLERAGRGLTRP